MKKIYIFVLVFALILSQLATASTASKMISFDEAELTSLEKKYFYNIHKNRNKLETYYDGFLIASGITENVEFEHYKGLLNKLRRDVAEYMKEHKNKTHYERGQLLLSWLYSSGTLKKYYLRSTLAGNLFDDGSYNCLSSTIIYTLLALELGLEPRAVFTSNHAFVSLNTEHGHVDVETTVAYGFNPGSKQIQEFEKEQRIVYVPRSNYNDRQYVDVDFLVASVYGNAISLVSSQNKNNLTSYKKGFYISPTSDFFRNNIIILLNNKAIDQIKYKNYEEAASLLSTAIKFDSQNSITERNVIYYYHQQGIDYLNANDYPSAISVFEHALEVTKNDISVKNNLKVAYYNYIVYEYKSNRFENAKIILSRAMKKFPNDKDFMELKKAVG